MPRFSRLAILTKMGLSCYFVLIVVWFFRVGQSSSLSRSLAVIVFVLALPMLVTGVGVWIPFFDNHRHHASASWREAFRTWRTEIWAVMRAGLWWQPFCWRQFPNSTSFKSKSAASPIPTFILLHGFVSNRGLWNPWLRLMESKGLRFVCINLEPLLGSIDDYIQAIEVAVGEAEQSSSAKPIVICHSMGGLALRKWLVSQPHSHHRIDKIVTIGTPHQGTWMGKLSLSANGREMSLGSEWLAELEAAERNARPIDTYAAFTCWYSNCDNIVVPAASARLPGASNRKIRGYGHLALVYHPQIMELEQYFPGNVGSNLQQMGQANS